ncbi:family 10 glycosylhydrolase [Paenibacillus marinisediminis]
MRKMGKKWLAACMTIVFLMTTIGSAQPALAESKSTKDEIRIFVNKQRLVTDVSPYIIPKVNVTMIPFRAIGDALGAEVTWDQKLQEVTFKKDETFIQMNVGKNTAIVSGEAVKLDAAPQIKANRTMVPLRFVAENLGLTVTWDQSTRTINMVTNGEEAAQTKIKGAWVSSVYNIDWPKDPRKGFDAKKQQEDYIALLDNLKEMGLNAVFVQIRPTADSFYPSAYFPWSEWLTGKQGKDPGYDPLAFMIEETHKRGMQFHAWFNPYRVSVQSDITKLTADHPARKHPDWVVKHNNKLWFDPGVPAVREYIIDSIMEVVTNYDIDGIHFDDYFYPYGQDSEPFNDDKSYEKYNKSFSNKEDWRRNNVNQFIQELSKQIKAEKPYVSFGVSPFGVWRNSKVDPTGSPTNAGVTSYDSLYADVRTWIRNGWIDYVAPQIYWHIGHKDADYAKLVDWWVKETAGTGVDLYIGHAAYKLADAAEKNWTTADVLIDQLKYNEQYSNIGGDIFFSAKDLTSNTKQVADRLREYYNTTDY